MREPRSARRAAGMVFLGLAAAVLSLSGCLVSEEQEESFVLHPEIGHGEYAVVLHNVQSDGPTPHHQQQDFDTMVKLLTGDDYLMDRLRAGIYVKRRGVTLEKGQLVARESGLFSEVDNVGLKFTAQGTILRTLTRGQKLVSTNGRSITEGDSVVVHWPKGTRELFLMTRVANFRPTANLIQQFNDWKAKHP